MNYLLSDVGYVKYAGWHLSYFMPVEDIQRKLESFCHREGDKAEIKDRQHIIESIREGRDLLGRDDVLFRYVNFSVPNFPFPKGYEKIQVQLERLQQ